MPRKGKGNSRGYTSNSAEGGVVAAPKINTRQDSHGERGALNDLQAAVPPGRPAPPQAAPQGGGPGAALAAAQGQMPQRGPGLGELSARPSEPISTGDPVGPGAGPSRRPGRTAKYLERIAAISDDPGLIQIAQRAQMKGL